MTDPIDGLSELDESIICYYSLTDNSLHDLQLPNLEVSYRDNDYANIDEQD